MNGWDGQVECAFGRSVGQRAFGSISLRRRWPLCFLWHAAELNDQHNWRVFVDTVAHRRSTD